jgi:hypothetical protein
MPNLAEFSPAERNQNPYHHIDPGFINFRQCFSAFGSSLLTAFERLRAPSGDSMATLHDNHVMVDLALAACREHQVRTLGEVLHDPKEGQLFASTEDLAGTKDVYKLARVRNRVLLPYQKLPRVVLEFGTEHILNDTGRLEQSSKHRVTIIGQVRSNSGTEIILAPLIMGAPSLEHPTNLKIGIPMPELAFHGWDWYETLPEDIDEFAKMKDVAVSTADEWVECMRQVKEETVKIAIAGLLGDNIQKDWGGEECDHFSADVHLCGARVTAAFALKGPAGGKKFKPMTPAMLGKHGDQIYRLAQTPARLLVVQHCHDVRPSVRDTLRSFAVRPSDPRRYCVVDGKTTYRLLKAYGKL